MKCIIEGCEEEQYTNHKEGFRKGRYNILVGSCYCKKHMDKKLKGIPTKG